MSQRDGKLLEIFVSVMLGSIGLVKCKKLNILCISVHVGCLCVGLLGGIVGFLNVQGVVGRIESLEVVSTNIACSCTYITSLVIREKIKRLLTSLKNNKDFCQNIVQKAAQFVNGKILLLIAIHSFLFTLFTLSWVWVLVTKGEISSQSGENLETMPYWYSCGSDGSHRAVKWFCWKVVTKRGYLLKNIIELLFGTVIYSASTYCFLLYCVIMAEFHVHVSAFKCKIDAVVEHVEWFGVRCRKFKGEEASKRRLFIEEYSVRMNNELKAICRYQHFLRRCAKEINTTFEPCNDVLITEYCAVLLSAILIVFHRSDGAMLLKSIPVCFSVILSLSLLCYFAHIISDTSDVISRELSKIQWYEQNISFQKNYLMVLVENCLPIRTKLFNARLLNLGFLLYIFRSLYSILNLLLIQIAE